MIELYIFCEEESDFVYETCDIDESDFVYEVCDDDGIGLFTAADPAVDGVAAETV